MAGGAYLSAKKGAYVFASKHFCKSAGVVLVMDGGPRSPELQIQTSRRPQVFRMSSMRVRVESSAEGEKG